jgi:DNA-binding NtrC family response regulator
LLSSFQPQPLVKTPSFENEIFPQYFPRRPLGQVPQGHGETVLVVDDEEAVRKGIARTLERRNYVVLTANCGIAAIQMFRQHQNEIDLVITDIVMPDMNGAILLRILRIFMPDLRAIAISGYAASCSEINLLQEDQRHFLAKPFETWELLAMVRDTLDEVTGSFEVIDRSRHSHSAPVTMYHAGSSGAPR